MRFFSCFSDLVVRLVGMFCRTLVSRRSAVAFFNMKHFQVQQKIAVTPSTIHDVFTKHLNPGDRLLRQSRAGAGATRILVLNKQQMVKAVYLPLLCVPHPSLVVGETAVLGLKVEEYLEKVKIAQENSQTVFAALSYPRGIAFGIYDSVGDAKIRLVNVDITDMATDAGIATGIGKHAMMNAGSPQKSRAKDFIRALSVHREQFLACESHYFVNRERGTCLMLPDVQRLASQSDPEEEMITGLEEKEEPLDLETLSSFVDGSRWVTLPEQALQSPQSHPLYHHGVPTEKGFQCAVSTGTLLLDFRPKGEKISKG